MMATEVQSGDLNNGSSSRLEVSIDGLTLSPDPEGEQEQVTEPDPELAEQRTEEQTATDGEDGEEGETAKSTIERKWGFPLLELYGLALKFFKGIGCSYCVFQFGDYTRHIEMAIVFHPGQT